MEIIKDPIGVTMLTGKPTPLTDAEEKKIHDIIARKREELKKRGYIPQYRHLCKCEK